MKKIIKKLISLNTSSFPIFELTKDQIKSKNQKLYGNGKIGWLSEDINVDKLTIIKIDPKKKFLFQGFKDRVYLAVLEGAILIKYSDKETILQKSQVLKFANHIELENLSLNPTKLLMFTHKENILNILDPKHIAKRSKIALNAPLIDADKQRSFFEDLKINFFHNGAGIHYSKPIDIKYIVFRKNKPTYNWATPHNTPRAQMVFNLQGATKIETTDQNQNYIAERIVKTAEFFVLTDIKEKGVGHATKLIQDGNERLSIFVPLSEQGVSELQSYAKLTRKNFFQRFFFKIFHK